MNNQQNEEIRMAGDYEIKQAIRIGGKEVVFGVNMNSENPYFCAIYSCDSIVEQYNDCMVSRGYAEMIRLFAQRVEEQADKVLAEQEQVNVPMITITADDCFYNDYSKNIEGKIVAVKADVLAPEYRTANHQLILVTGGNGSHGNARGNACFYINLYTGKHGRWERYDIQGEVKPEAMPDWAKQREAEIRKQLSNENHSSPPEPKARNADHER